MKLILSQIELIDSMVTKDRVRLSDYDAMMLREGLRRLVLADETRAKIVLRLMVNTDAR